MLGHTRRDGSPRLWIIYLLSDPIDGEIRYVGKAIEQKGHRQTYEAIAAHRLRNHIYCARNRGGSYRLHWIRSLLEAGLEPEITIIITGSGLGCPEAEVHYIAAGRALGLRLTNSTIGGEGAPGRRHSDKTRAAFSAAASKRTGWTHSEEAKAKIGNAHRGRKVPIERAEKIANSLRGRKRSQEAVERTAASHRGRKRSNETRAKMGDWQRGRKLSDEHRANISKARKNFLAVSNKVPSK